jgi:ABC-type amino acid transport system permease subunit
MIMTSLIDTLPPGFIDDLLRGMALNFEISALTLLLGLLFGIPVALAQLRRGLLGFLAASVVALMRAVPTFLVMFFLLYALPRRITLGGIVYTPPGTMIVAASLLPYAAAYVSDNFLDAVRQWRAGSALAALQLLPNLTRAFFVMVMASSAGAAIGVTEAITVLMRYAGRYPNLSDRLGIYALGVVCFGVTLQAGLIMVNLTRHALSDMVVRRSAIRADLEARSPTGPSFGGR